MYCEFGVGLYCKHGKVWFPWLYDSTSMTFRHWECKLRKRYEWDWIIHLNCDMYYSYKETGNFIRIMLVYKIITKFTNKMQQLSSLSEYHCTFQNIELVFPCCCYVELLSLCIFNKRMSIPSHILNCLNGRGWMCPNTQYICVYFIIESYVCTAYQPLQTTH